MGSLSGGHQCSQSGSYRIKAVGTLLLAEQTGFCIRSEEHTSELQSRQYLVCRLLLEKKKNRDNTYHLHRHHTHVIQTSLHSADSCCADAGVALRCLRRLCPRVLIFFFFFFLNKRPPPEISPFPLPAPFPT